MRNTSFMLTKDQIRTRTKTVTRRLGWWKLEPGDVLRGVEKGMGLKPGEKVVPLATIKIVSVRAEPLRALTDDATYGLVECEKEGFGTHPSLRWPSEFVRFFCGSHKGCTPDSTVNRIEFEFVDHEISASKK